MEETIEKTAEVEKKPTVKYSQLKEDQRVLLVIGKKEEVPISRVVASSLNKMKPIFEKMENDFENNDHNSSIKIITDFSLGQFFGKTIFENKDLQKIKKANSKLFDLQIEEFWKVLKLDIFYIRNTIKSWSESKYNFLIQNKKIFIVDKKNSILEIKKTALIKFNMQLKMEIIFMFKTKLEEMINKINNQIFEYQI